MHLVERDVEMSWHRLQFLQLAELLSHVFFCVAVFLHRYGFGINTEKYREVHTC